ncbi:peptidase domain-containing ABC transporter, partial [Vibrio aestuarianus subsp. cardii]
MNILQFHSENQVPVILQNESSECGLCCVLMIASFYGYESNLSTERQKNMMPSHGMKLFDLMKVSESMNLIGRGLRVDINNLKSLKVPCILHWNMNHFVVLKSVKKNHVIIHDPSTGIVKLAFEQVSDSFTGVALELTPSSEFIQNKEVKRLRISQLWNNSVGIKKALLQIITLSVILQFFATISPFYIQLVIDSVIIDNNFELLIMLALSFSTFLIFNVITEYVRSIFMLRLTSTLNVSMSMNVFRHLLRLPLSYFENRHVGDIVSRFNSLGEIRKAISSGVAGIVIDAFMSIITLVMMAIYNIHLTLTVITIILLYIALRVSMYSKMRQLTNDSIHTHALENSSFMESLRTIQSIKIFGKENHRQNTWSNKYIKSVNADISIQKYQIIFLIFNRLIFGLGNIIVIY